MLASLASIFTLFINLTCFVKADLAPGSVKKDPNLSEKEAGQKAAEYFLTQPIVPGPFTGDKSGDMEEILPFYTSPLTKYSLDLNSGKQNYKPGETLNLTGKISYSYDDRASQRALKELGDCQGCALKEIIRFPALSDVGVFAQVWRKDDNQASSQKGDYLIDEFYLANNLNLNENEPQNINFKWQIPDQLKAGNYYIFFFINSGKRFNLSGTPLTAFDQAGTYDFIIKDSDAGSGVELDKNNIKIDDREYIYRQPAPEIEPKDGKITISLPIANLSPDSQKIKLTYTLYGWGQEDPADVIDTKQENKTLGAGEKTDLSFTFSPSETGTVYNLEIKAISPSSMSTVNARFLTKGLNRGILRFLGQGKNEQGVMLPVFCLRNAAWTNLFHGKVKISGLSANGQSFFDFIKEGSMRPEDRCFAIKNTNWNNGGKITSLQGEIYDDNGNLVDKKIVSLAKEKPASSSKIQALTQTLSNNLPANKLQIVFFTFLVIVVGVGGYLIFLKTKKV